MHAQVPLLRMTTLWIGRFRPKSHAATMLGRKSLDPVQRLVMVSRSQGGPAAEARA